MHRMPGVALTSLLVSNVAIAAESSDAVAFRETRVPDSGHKATGWKHQPLLRLRRDTVNPLVKEAGGTVLHAAANGSASLGRGKWQTVRRNLADDYRRA